MRLIGIAILVSIPVLTFAYTTTMVTSHFAWYDDEGFMLFTLRQFDSGAPLYDEMYTEYGPFYYLAVTHFLAFFDLPITHDVIRILTIVLWTILALGGALWTWFWSRSAAWSVAALLASATLLAPVYGEPGHPQLLVHLLVLIAFAALILQRTITREAAFCVVGAATGAILTTKINIGIFMLLSLGAICVVPASRNPLFAKLRPIVILCCLMLPTALMYRQLGSPAAFNQWALITFAVGFLVYALRHSSYEVGSAPVWATLGLLLVVLPTLVVTLLTGTSTRGLLNGLLLQPIAFSHAIPYQVPDSALLLCGTLACVWGAMVLLISRTSRTALMDRVRYPAASLLALISNINPAMCLYLAPAFLWLFVPYRIDDDRKAGAAFITSTATFGLLIAYPVAGTQINLSTFLVFLAAISGLFWRVPSPDVTLRTFKGPVVLVLLICLAVINGAVGIAVSRVSPKVATDLPHSSLINLSLERAALFKEITGHIAKRCNALVTIPGMNSFHVWTDVPRVTPYTLSAAMVLFDTKAQEGLREAFLASSRPCVIYYPELEKWSGRFRPTRHHQPFMEFVKYELVPVYSRSGYEIRIPAADVEGWQP